MVSIYSTLFFPLKELDGSAAVAAGWERGPFGSGRSSFQMPTLDARRTQFYVNSSPLRALLAADNRVHSLVPRTAFGAWKAFAAELVECRSLESSGLREIKGYLIVHLEQMAESREISALTGLGEFVRPERKASSTLLAMITEATGLESSAWELALVPRVYALSLSDTPAENHEGSVRWDGSSAVQRRLAGLVALPPKSSIRVADASPWNRHDPLRLSNLPWAGGRRRPFASDSV